MEILGAFFCDSANINSSTGKIDIHGIYNELGSKKFPTKLNETYFAVLLEKTFFDEIPKKLEVKFIDEDGKEFYSSIYHSYKDDSKPDKHNFFILKNINFNYPGTYNANIFVDGVAIKSVKLRLVQD